MSRRVVRHTGPGCGIQSKPSARFPPRATLTVSSLTRHGDHNYQLELPTWSDEPDELSVTIDEE
ncbi:hypothetical protein VTH82DRAFT_2873 [Thermothelomyces myriococcoides]